MNAQDLVSPAAQPAAEPTGLRELTLQEMQAVAGGGLLLSERTQQLGPVSNGLLLSE
jgi:hypothetical protein